MRHLTFCALLIAALCFAQASNIRDLKCENAVNPRVVSNEHPVFSWAWGVPTTPRAYQILVSSSEEKLKADIADLWDSGQVRGDKKSAQYQGKPLESMKRYYWKLRVWSDYDTPTPWTETQTFQMTLFAYVKP